MGWIHRQKHWQASVYEKNLEGAIEMTFKNKALEHAIMQIEALNSPEAVMARHNELMIARSKEMNASPRGRHFIAKYGDPIELKNKLPKAWKWA
tara:strand:+ start:447 stop:728 length:282 start_codon:yes stop_codon:yes gene_type:complete